ncbi:adenosine deaminase-like protein [Coprinopsis marcescibilis]|uniref:Adenosine deaminase-like protein n=1 Tax=Coprinopsis marcescibilis TaxID=230819 RepID=A0A5C3L9G0_COPMA|nr:adenosine deaminase-like protein [Coprinopsis marcescibilis]
MSSAQLILGQSSAALSSLSPSQVTFLQTLPKAELHAHLNGSIPLEVLQELADEYTPPPNSASRPHLDKAQIQQCIDQFKAGTSITQIGDFFQLFPAIYALTSTPDALKRVTRAVLADFLDGDSPQCAYLELRTGPRESEAMSREEYMLAVLEEVEKYDADRAGLILTLDRKTGEGIWKECLEIALKLKREGRRIVGVDMAGDPLAADVASFESFFAEAKKAGLGLTLHIAETSDNTPEESRQLLSYRPNRLGHATFLDDEAIHTALGDNICIEICLSSNLLCKTVRSLEEHHIRHYLKHHHPIAICTDDSLVFRTNLVAEYALLLAQPPLGLGFTESEVREIARMGMDSRFK